MKRIIFFIIAASLFLTGCVKKPKVDPSEIEDYDAKKYVYSFMNSLYYWCDSLPENVSMEKKDLFRYYEDMLYKKDRWSWMTTYEEWVASETGVYGSYGASIAQPLEYYGDYSVKVRYVFPDTPLSDVGVTRGWTLTKIGGVDVMDLIKNNTFADKYNQTSNSFTFRDLKGNVHTFDLSARTISVRSYLRKQIFTSEDFAGLPHSVGYFNYLSFNQNMLSDISDAFAEFAAAGVGDIILDLRYNGGGNEKALSKLANYIAPASSQGMLLATRKHNANYSKYDTQEQQFVSRESGAMNLGRLFVITGEGSASASEVLINGLRPMFGKENLMMVGDTTYGKPNGMYVLPYPEGTADNYYGSADYIFYPICFFTANVKGEQIPVTGMLPDNYRADDLYHDWGVEEDLIRACLAYIKDGSYPTLPAKRFSSETKSMAGNVKIATEEDAPGYGRYEYLLP